MGTERDEAGGAPRDTRACVHTPTHTITHADTLAHALSPTLTSGREESGLLDSELLRCGHACAIPSGGANASLNLSHAVAVVLAQLYEMAAAEGGAGTCTCRRRPRARCGPPPVLCQRGCSATPGAAPTPPRQI